MKKILPVLLLSLMMYGGENISMAATTAQRWLPVVIEDSNWKAFIFVVNVSEVEVTSLTLTGYYTTGNKIGELQLTLSPHQGKIIPLESRPFGAAISDPRLSVKMTMDKNNILLAAVSVTSAVETRDDLILFQSVAGDTTEVVAPFITNLTPYETYLTAVNTSSSRGGATCREYNSGGSLAVEKTYQLEAQEQKYGAQTDFFPGYRGEAWADFSDRVTTLAGAFIYYNDTFKRKNYFSAPLCGQALSKATIPLCAFLVNDWKSHVVIANPTSSFGTAVLSAWRPDGFIVGIERKFTVPPKGYVKVDIDHNTFSQFLPTDGIYSLEMTSETAGLQYLAFHITYVDLNYADIPPAPVAPADSVSAQAPVFVDTAEYSTYVALKNSGASSGTYSLRAYDYSGGVIDEKTVFLNAHASSFTNVKSLLSKTAGKNGWLEIKPSGTGKNVAMQTVYINNRADRRTYYVYTSNVN